MEKERRLEKVKEYSKRILEKYGGYIKCIVMIGSVVRGEFESKSDTDVLVIIDDASFEITPEKHRDIDEDLRKIAGMVSENISLMPIFTLTEFWDYVRTGHPTAYNLIKEGMAIHDTGFFNPLKKLLEMGRIPATREAVERHIEEVPKRLIRAKSVKLLIVADDCYYTMLNAAQAVLMFMGLAPPVPSKAYDDVKKFLVEPGILEPEYAEWLKEIIETRKKIEHKELIEVEGKFVDKWIEKAEKFVNKIFNVLNVLETVKKREVIRRMYEAMQETVISVLNSLNSMSKEEEVSTAFKRVFVDSKLIDPYYAEVWYRVKALKRLSDENRLAEVPDSYVYKTWEDVKRLIQDLAKILRERGKSMIIPNIDLLH